MFLKHGKLKDREVLSIAHNYRDPKTKQIKHKTIEFLGYVDELSKKYPDPVAHFKEIVIKMNADEEAKKALCKISIDPKTKLDRDSRKNIGYAALSQIYHKLGLNILFNNRSKTSKAEYSVNDIMKTEIYSRILFPDSKKATYENRGIFFEKNDYSLDDVYRCLSFVNSFKDDIVRHLHDNIVEKYGRTTEIMYYDVTNYYFEIDEQDELRKVGVSKEHRPDPIVQMGLLQDSNGVPVTYKLFAGNTNDCETLIPILNEVKRDFNIAKTIVVADKGLNTHRNIVHNILEGNGYVYSQTVRGGHKELKDYVLEQNNYRKMGETSRIKSRIYPRLITVTDVYGKRKSLRIDEKQVVFYSEDYATRAKREREPAILKAKDMIRNPAKYNRANSYGAAKYVKNLCFNEETGEVATSQIWFDEHGLSEEEKWDGYYAIVTSEIDKTDEEIIEIYRGLWRIEESFKVTKSGIESRPVYLSREDHIQAHFLICFISLTVLRLLENQLKNKFHAQRLAQSLSLSIGFSIGENWYAFGYADEVTVEIENQLQIPLTNKFLTTNEIRKILGNTKK
jgi:transposase